MERTLEDDGVVPCRGLVEESWWADNVVAIVAVDREESADVS
jgi:hypothetical protein